MVAKMLSNSTGEQKYPSPKLEVTFRPTQTIRSASDPLTNSHGPLKTARGGDNFPGGLPIIYHNIIIYHTYHNRGFNDENHLLIIRSIKTRKILREPVCLWVNLATSEYFPCLPVNVPGWRFGVFHEGGREWAITPRTPVAGRPRGLGHRGPSPMKNQHNVYYIFLCTDLANGHCWLFFKKIKY